MGKLERDNNPTDCSANEREEKRIMQMSARNDRRQERTENSATILKYDTLRASDMHEASVGYR